MSARTQRRRTAERHDDKPQSLRAKKDEEKAARWRAVAHEDMRRAIADPGLLGLERILLAHALREVERTGAPVPISAAKAAELLGVPERAAARMIKHLVARGYVDGHRAKAAGPAEPTAAEGGSL